MTSMSDEHTHEKEGGAAEPRQSHNQYKGLDNMEDFTEESSPKLSPSKSGVDGESLSIE